MALDKLLASLETEAAAEAARLGAEAAEQAAQIVEEARAQARALAERAADDTEAELRNETEQRRADARLAAAAAHRAAWEEAFQEFLADVRARLADLRERPRYTEVLRALVRESLAVLPDAATVRVDPRDEALARALLDELGTQTDVSAALTSAGGVEVLSGDGRTARNTIEERLGNAEPALRLLFGEILDGAETGRNTSP